MCCCYSPSSCPHVILFPERRIFEKIEPGVLFRSAQHDGATLDVLVRKEGIRAVLNLQRWYDDKIAASACDGVRHFDLELPPTRELVKRLKAAPKPSLIHCNGGADRSGLGSALHELRIAGRPIDQVAGRLSFSRGCYGAVREPWIRPSIESRRPRRAAQHPRPDGDELDAAPIRGRRSCFQSGNRMSSLSSENLTYLSASTGSRFIRAATA